MNPKLPFARWITMALGIYAGIAGATPGDDAAAAPNFERITISGDKIKSGIFDVSIEYDDTGTGWLAYSWIAIPKYVETHLAMSTNQGRTWNFAGVLEKSTESTIEENGKTVKGAWREETPCLLFDPADEPARRWKLFTNRYFVADPYKPLDRRMSSGTINMRYASRPDSTWSPPVCVVGNDRGCRIDLRKADATLANVRMNTEPGAIVDNGVIYMSLDAGSTHSGLGEWENYRVLLVSSPDRGKSWTYVGTLLTADDAKAFGYRVFTGTSLVRANGKLYLFATPSGAYKGKNQAHDGLMVMEFARIDRATIIRDNKGTPVVIKRISPNRTNGGLADYDEQNKVGGILLPQVSMRNFPTVFQTFDTRQHIEDSR